MTQPEQMSGQWKVSARAPGGILTTFARDGGVELGLMGTPGGYTPDEIQGWLQDLIGVARETSGSDTQTRAIPALLHHGLTGLLFSHEQLWNQEGQAHPVSYAFVSTDPWVGFGWVGDLDVQVWVDGDAVQPDAIIVRDDMGREGNAFVTNASHSLVVRLSWPRGAEESSAATVVAEWAGKTAAGKTPPLTEVQPQAEPQMETVQATAADEPLGIESSGVWFANDGFPTELPASQQSAAAPAPASTPEPEPVSTPAPASAEPTEPVAEAAPVSQSPTLQDAVDFTPAPEQPAFAEEQATEMAVMAMDTPADGDPSMQAPAASSDDDATAATKGSGLKRMFARLAFWKRDEANAEAALTMPEGEVMEDIPGVPDQIPPTPEPAELTERTVNYMPGLPPEVIEFAEAKGPEEVSEEAPDSPFFAIAAEIAAANAPRPELQAEPELRAAPEIVPEPELTSTPEPARDPEPQPEPRAVLPAEQAAAPVASAAVSDSAVLPEVPPQGEQLEAEELVEAGSTSARVPMRPEWPAAHELEPPTPIWKRPVAWVAVIAALFAGGWLVGHLQTGESKPSAQGGVAGMLRGLGLGGAHFEVMVNSRPQGAWIALDGEDLALRTPASIEVPPGEHQITLSFSDHGGATYDVRGVDGDQLSVDAALWGSVSVYSSDSAVPVAVSVDGESRGFAPTSVDSLAPGTHELRFSGPGLPSWGQTVQVRVQEVAEVVARPMTSPATGLIEVRATLATQTGADPLEGAEVWVDGRPQGVTPMSIELPRGPHSIRVTLGDDSSPVQVIDLPGGNQRFARFQLGLNSGAPRLQAIDPPAAVALDRSSVLSVALDQVGLTELKEMWLHVETPNGTWRRYEMALMKAPDGVVGVTVFPNTLFNDKGLVRFYASARTHVGDEYYTEIQRAKAAEQ